MLFHPHDVRDDLARLLDDDHVADPDVFALDLVGIVQAGAADDGAGQFHRLQIGHRRDGPGLADLHADVAEPGRGLVLLELVGDRPSAGSCSCCPAARADRSG